MKVQVRFIVTSAVVLAAASFAGCGPRAGIDGGNIGIDSGASCGNGVVEPPEQCDPPNPTTCGANCMTTSMCGDSVIQLGEQCDDGNTVSGDGCSATCQNETVTTPANPGAACTSDAGCSDGGIPGTQANCLDEATFGFPAGYCLLQGCTTPNMAMGIADNCPTSSHCEGFGDGMGGTVNYCLPDCTPSATGIGACRTDTTANDAYTCLPSVIDPAVGGCWLGCENDLGCNGCDTMAGTCFNDGTTACTSETDCAATPTALVCNTAINACHPDHAAGAGTIGDPCTSDLDCPQFASCLGDGTASDPVWPGGYCAQFYCDSYGSLPEFQCPGGSVCPASSGFFGGLLQICSGACTLATGTSGEGNCDTDRGDNFHYVCIENSTPTMSLGKLFDTNGAAGFCFQCEALFGPDPACP